MYFGSGAYTDHFWRDFWIWLGLALFGMLSVVVWIGWGIWAMVWAS